MARQMPGLAISLPLFLWKQSPGRYGRQGGGKDRAGKLKMTFIFKIPPPWYPEPGARLFHAPEAH